MKRTIAWLLAAMLLIALVGCGEQEAPAPVEETVSGALYAFDGAQLQLDGDASFALGADTTLSLARGFIAGDSFAVTYLPASGAVFSVTSERAADEEFVICGSVKSIGHLSVLLEGEDGGNYRFSLSAAELDLWQGLEKGIYVEARGLGRPGENSECVWLQSLRDNDGKALLSPEAEEAAEESAEEVPDGEATEAPVAEAPERVLDGEELPWALETVEDEVWVSEATNLRLGPGLDYTRMATVNGGETLARLGMAGDWSLVEYDDRQGYVSNDFLLEDVPERSYVIHYDAAGGENAPADQYKAIGVDITLSAEIPMRDGYRFNGWNTDPDGYGIRYNPGERFEMDEDIVFYAQWLEGEAMPTPDLEAEEGEEAQSEPAEPTPTPEPAPIRDSCRALSGVIESVAAEELVLDASGVVYTFDISNASLTAERGLHAGDNVRLWYAGEIRADGEEGNAERAPAVWVEATAGEARLEGEVVGLWADGAALDVDGVLVFVQGGAKAFSVGDAVTATLKPEAAAGNLLAAVGIE